MKNKIENIKKLLEEQIIENQKHYSKISQIKADNTYSDEYKAETTANLCKEYKNKSALKRDEILKAVEELRNAEKTILDLSDSRLNNAISLICTLGNNIPVHTLKAIENEFRGNQAGLEALKGAYQKAGLETYRLDKNIYDVDATYKKLAQGIYDSFRTPERISKVNETFTTLKMIEEVCEPSPVEEVKIQVNTMPKMI